MLWTIKEEYCMDMVQSNTEGRATLILSCGAVGPSLSYYKGLHTLYTLSLFCLLSPLSLSFSLFLSLSLTFSHFLSLSLTFLSLSLSFSLFLSLSFSLSLTFPHFPSLSL